MFRLSPSRFVVSLAAGVALAVAVPAQESVAPTNSSPAVQDMRLRLKYADFDPLAGEPMIPETLLAGADTDLWIVQFDGVPTAADRRAMAENGGRVVVYLPNNAYVVRGAVNAAAVGPRCRWVGAFHPAYRLQSELITEHVAGAPVPERRYNLVMSDKRRDKAALARKIAALGGEVVSRETGGLLMIADLDAAELIAAARLDEVLWIDRRTEIELDMAVVRATHGADAVETLGGYTGSGVRGHVYEGVEFDHPDFTTPMTNVRSNGAADRHGHCTAGIVFGNGTSWPSARGMAPDAVGFYTNASNVSPGWSRNAVINDVVNVHECMFTTASWGFTATTQYTSVSADADDIVFDHRIPWTQSQANEGTQFSREQAWAKNVISVGALWHYNNLNENDDEWDNPNSSNSASTGPAADGRIKPDLCSYFDNIRTSDLTGAAGYTNGSYYSGFNGTSAATPIVAGANALAIQMYTDHVFGVEPRVPGGSRFENRPYAQTLKALQIACAKPYDLSQATRVQGGWGKPQLERMYERRSRIFIVPEDRTIQQGQTHRYDIDVLPGEETLRVCLTWLDPAASVAASVDRVNDLNLRVTAPNGLVYYWGNNGLDVGNTSTAFGSSNSIDTVECVVLNTPAAGRWTVRVFGTAIVQDGHVATSAVDSTYALAVFGGREQVGSGCNRFIPDTVVHGAPITTPFGARNEISLPTTMQHTTTLVQGGTVYFNVTTSTPTYINALALNTSGAIGTYLLCDVFITAPGGTYNGNELNPSAWTPVAGGHGTSAGVGNPSRIDLTQPIRLAGGARYGFAVRARNFNHAYTAGAFQSFSNGDVTIDGGRSSSGLFAGSVFSPRVVNVHLKYRRDNQQETNQRYQQIVRRDQLGAAGTITSLAVMALADGRHWNDRLRIRMSEVPAGYQLSTSFGANLPNPVTVLDTENHWFDQRELDWSYVGLQSGFAYSGNGDLVIEVIAEGNHSTTNTVFRSSSQATSLFRSGWTGTPPLTGQHLPFSGMRLRVGMNCATASSHGSSCGTLRAHAVGEPVHGQVARFSVTGALPNGGVIASLGLGGVHPTPPSLNSFGWLNCTTWHNVAATVFLVAGPTGIQSYDIQLPSGSSFDGLSLQAQFYGIDALAPGGLTVSNYARNVIGRAQ